MIIAIPLGIFCVLWVLIIITMIYTVKKFRVMMKENTNRFSHFVTDTKMCESFVRMHESEMNKCADGSKIKAYRVMIDEHNIGIINNTIKGERYTNDTIRLKEWIEEYEHILRILTFGVYKVSS